MFIKKKLFAFPPTDIWSVDSSNSIPLIFSMRNFFFILFSGCKRALENNNIANTENVPFVEYLVENLKLQNYDDYLLSRGKFRTMRLFKWLEFFWLTVFSKLTPRMSIGQQWRTFFTLITHMATQEVEIKSAYDLSWTLIFF